MLGSYSVNVSVSGMPQAVASAWTEKIQSLVGASYKFIAYLGSQVVNGKNHAILAEQTVVAAQPTKNIVLITMHQPTTDIDGSTFDDVKIEQVLNGAPEGFMGGIAIDAKTGHDIPDAALRLFTSRLGQMLGTTNRPFALLGTQVTNGICYFYAIKTDMVIQHDGDATALVPAHTSTIKLVKLSTNSNDYEFFDLIAGHSADGVLGAENTNNLGYAFTWLGKK